MKFLIFFMLLVNSKGFEFNGFGKKLELPTAVFIKFIEEIEKNDSFYKAINMEYENHNISSSFNDTNVLEAFVETNDHLEALKKIFTNAAIRYISMYLISFCSKVIEIIDQKKNEYIITQDIIDDIKIERDHGYCMVTFLYNCGADVETILRVMIFLQTYFDGEVLEHRYVYLRRELVKLLNLLTDFDNPDLFVIDNNKNGLNKCSDSTPETDSGNSITYEKIEPVDPQPPCSANVELEEIKKIFTAFANKFCVSTVPKVMDIEHSPENEYEHHRNRIVNYIFEYEGCEVTLQKFRVNNLAMQDIIEKWECKNILETQEYGIVDYVDEVTDMEDKEMFTREENMFESDRSSFEMIDSENLQRDTRDTQINSEAKIKDDTMKNNINSHYGKEYDTHDTTNKEIHSDTGKAYNSNDATNKEIKKGKEKLLKRFKSKSKNDRENQSLSINSETADAKAAETSAAVLRKTEETAAESRTAEIKEAEAKAADEKTTKDMQIKSDISSKIPSREVRFMDVIYLATIKNTLKSFYLNAVNYNNIISDIIILALIKEGKKLIDLIKSVFQRRNKSNDDILISIEEIHKMRQQLIILQIFFDKLADKIFEKLLIDVTKNTEKKFFDRKVETMLKYLDTSGYESHIEFEKSASKNILALVSSEDDFFFHDKFHFNEFYFVLPVLHMNEFINWINS